MCCPHCSQWHEARSPRPSSIHAFIQSINQFRDAKLVGYYSPPRHPLSMYLYTTELLLYNLQCTWTLGWSQLNYSLSRFMWIRKKYIHVSIYHCLVGMYRYVRYMPWIQSFIPPAKDSSIRNACFNCTHLNTINIEIHCMTRPSYVHLNSSFLTATIIKVLDIGAAPAF